MNQFNEIIIDLISTSDASIISYWLERKRYKVKFFENVMQT